jgi:AGZA family xanthine/uracil permease-like MFS transporter
MRSFLDRFFNLPDHHTSIRKEVLAGMTTFLTMSYIIFINPSFLALAGMDHGAVFVATCVAAAIGSLLMGMLANYPIALAPGMGLNAYFTFGVVLGAGYHWQVALGAVFISGIIFLALSVLPIREYIIISIPKPLKLAIVSGIGFFLAIIGLKSAGIIVGSKATLVAMGSLHNPTVLLAIVGFFLIVGLEALEINGAVIISILFVSITGLILGYGKFTGVFSMPPSIMPTLMQMDLKSAFNPALISIILAFLFVDLFDNTGTLIAVAHRAGLMGPDGKLPRISRALTADSLAAIVSAMLGTSTTTSYVESVVGVRAGGRTGLTAVVVALLFLIALFLAPLASSIQIYATAPALIYVACLMTRAFTEIDWDDITEYTPSVITAICMPLTFSVADGISFGFISYVVIKTLSGRYRDLNVGLVVLAIAFVGKYALIS